MSFTPYAQQYEGHKWIKVKRFERLETHSWEDNYNRLERHHGAETKFLIAEVRTLASLLDQKDALIAQLRGNSDKQSFIQEPQTSSGTEIPAGGEDPGMS